MKWISCTGPSARSRTSLPTAAVRGENMKGNLGFLTARAGGRAAKISQMTGRSAVAVGFPENQEVEQR
jgi:hypothetical protein